MAIQMDRAGKILQRIANIGNGGQVINYRDVTCPNCGAVYAVGYSDVPHSVDKIHRICDTCMMPIEVKNPWNEKETNK